MNNLKRNLIVAGLFVSGSMLLTGCNTVKGTVQGASRDIKNVVTTVEQPVTHKRVASHKAHAHSHVAKKNVETNKSVAHKTPVKSSVPNNAQQMQQHSATTTMTPSTPNSSN